MSSRRAEERPESSGSPLTFSTPAEAATPPGAGPPDGAADWIESVWEPIVAVRPMPGGAGARRYWRVAGESGATAVLMHAVPEDPRILPPALRVAGRGIPFLEVTALLAGLGLPVPAILASELPRRWVLLEDLGGTHLCDLEATQRSVRHEEAVRLLARVHGLTDRARGTLPFERPFDRTWVRFELRLFAELELPESLRGPLDAAIEAIAAYIESLPRVLSLRDYQSQNLMIDANGRLRILDYQDALLAPPALDLAALLYDSYVDIAPAWRAHLLGVYEQAAGTPVDRTALAVVAAERKCKDFSRYRFVSRTKGDTRYAAFEAPARAAILEALAAFPAELAVHADTIRAAVDAASGR